MDVKRFNNIKCPWCRAVLDKNHILSQSITKDGRLLNHLQCGKCKRFSISFDDVEN